MRRVIIIMAIFGIFAGCGSKNNGDTYSYPHDNARRDLAKIYMIDDSYGHSVTIMANDTVVWQGVVPYSDIIPNVNVVGIPPEMQGECRIRISGGPYSADMNVDWAQGKALTVAFNDNGVDISQQVEPVGFD